MAARASRSRRRTALVRGVLDAIAAEHPKADDLLDFCRAENARIEAFCRERDLIGLADDPLVIRWTPVFLRSFGGAMLSSPGPLDKGQKAFFAITPMPDDWSDEQRESNLREDNDRMLRVLTIHEAVPGHYLQGVYANRCPSIVRAIFGSGVFAEGWAVYVTQVMMDVGYGADDPGADARPLEVLPARRHQRDHRSRASTCAGMTEDEAVALMVDGGFQEHAEARAKFDRARLSSTQLSTYFAGSLEMWDIEREVRRRAAVASGDPRGAAAVPEPRVVGGFGETPGFVYRTAPRIGHLATGRPPTSLLPAHPVRRESSSGTSSIVSRASGFGFYVTGPWALSVYAEPRMTRDLDVVIDLDAVAYERRIRPAFDDDYLVNDPIDLGGRWIGGLVHRVEIVRVDLMFGRHDAWARSAFERSTRRSTIPASGRSRSSQPEDLILAKLEWSDGGSFGASSSRLPIDHPCRNAISTGATLSDTQSCSESTVCWRAIRGG